MDFLHRKQRRLRQDRIATTVGDSIQYGDGELRHYQIGAWVVVPNHAHLLTTPGWRSMS